MLEKSGTICLTSSEVDQIYQGVLPPRVKEVWGLSIHGAQDIVKRGLFTLIEDLSSHSKVRRKEKKN